MELPLANDYHGQRSLHPSLLTGISTVTGMREEVDTGNRHTLDRSDTMLSGMLTADFTIVQILLFTGLTHRKLEAFMLQSCV